MEAISPQVTTATEQVAQIPKNNKIHLFMIVTILLHKALPSVPG
jgi:hypothetical protein